jgi:hypothetical protein
MTMHLLDLRLAEVLTEERLQAARQAHTNLNRRHWVPGVPAKKSQRDGRVVLHWTTQLHRPTRLHRPLHGTAGH